MTKKVTKKVENVVEIERNDTVDLDKLEDMLKNEFYGMIEPYEEEFTKISKKIFRYVVLKSKKFDSAVTEAVKHRTNAKGIIDPCADIGIYVLKQVKTIPSETLDDLLNKFGKLLDKVDHEFGISNILNAMDDSVFAYNLGLMLARVICNDERED